MPNEDLLSGKKEQLLMRIRKLKPVYGARWRKLLKEHNAWHSTEKGLYAWENIRKGTTGNEALRLILHDMEAIIIKSAPEATAPPDPKLRERLIADSLKSLKRTSKTRKSLQNV